MKFISNKNISKKQKSRAFIKMILGVLLFCSSFGYSADLKCSYLQDIQEKYLNLHISFSNFDKKKKKKTAFKVRMAKLENRTKEQFIKFIDPEKNLFHAI